MYIMASYGMDEYEYEYDSCVVELCCYVMFLSDWLDCLFICLFLDSDFVSIFRMILN